ncbi:MAG: ATP-binding protein [Polyangiaceae bacterium]|nr:ATP-binding protein [Polyangiaceae bacterium]
MSQANDLGTVLGARVRRAFVGRVAELAALGRALEQSRETPQLVLVAGSAGVGKTTLLRRFALDVGDAGGRTVFVPFVERAPSGAAEPPSLGATERALAAHGPDLGRRAAPDVLAFDGSGAVDVDPYLRLLEQLGSLVGPRLCVVVATRARRALRLRVDPGFQKAFAEVELRNFARDEATAFLLRRGVPGALADELFALTGGHPLALALLADRTQSDPRWRPSWTASPELLALLVRELCADAPSSGHREVLELAAMVEPLDEALAADVLGRSLRAEFAWLWQSPLAELDAEGVRLTPLARELLHRELVQDRAALARLGPAVVAALVARLAAASSPELARRALHALVVARRDLPRLRDGRLATAIARTECGRSELPAPVASGVGRGVLRDAAGALALGLVRGPLAEVARALGVAAPPGMESPPGTELCCLLADEAQGSAAGTAAAPATALALLCAVAAEGALRGDGVRFGVATREPEAWLPGPATASGAAEPELLGDPGKLRLVLLPEAGRVAPPALHPACAFALASVGLLPLPEATRAGQPQPLPVAPPAGSALAAAPAPPSPVALGAEAFAAAVRAALQSFHRGHELRDSPLADCAAVLAVARAGRERTAALQGVLRALVDEMAKAAGYADEARVLRATFLEPSVKQQAAAAELGMPYGTYRHRLRAALAVYVALLWHKELAARVALGA